MKGDMSNFNFLYCIGCQERKFELSMLWIFIFCSVVDDEDVYSGQKDYVFYVFSDRYDFFDLNGINVCYCDFFICGGIR